MARTRLDARRPLVRARTLLVAAGILGGAGCSLALGFEECADDKDCSNSEGRPLVCRNHTCVETTNPADVACEANSDCTAVFGNTVTCGPSLVCASLTSDECKVLEQPDGYDPDKIVYIGSILPTSPPYDTSIVPIQNAIQLAVEDFNSVATLPNGQQIGWIGCDSQGKSDVAVTAAKHLAQDVGVPAIVGPGLSDPVVAVAQQVTIGAGVFLISPTATAKTITDLADNGLVWRTITSDVYQANALADRMPLLDPQPSRILVLAKDDAYGNGLLADAVPRMRKNLPGASIASLVYPGPEQYKTNDDLKKGYGEVIAKGYPQNADTVVVLGTSEARELILFYLATWDAQNQMPGLARFVVSHGGVPELTEVVNGVDQSFRSKLMSFLEGTSPIIEDPQNFEAYNIRYGVRFSQDALTASSLGYDAAMVTMMAMVGAQQAGDTGGVGIAKAMPRLVSGTAVAFRGDSLDFISRATDVLASGGSVNLDGVSGALDFDLVTGEPRTDLIGWGLTPKTGSPTVPLLTALRQYVLDPKPAKTGTWMDLP